MTGAITQPDNLIILATFAAVVAITALTALAVLAVDTWRSIRARRVGDGLPILSDCPWCRTPGSEKTYAIPRDCVCPAPCPAIWCQRWPATR